ncbi:MAG TPA: hypothetical protein PLP42_06495 [Acidobacteriota bacterium]|nr:hypothetical protein [Acidobacteriota bacterium]
MAATGEGKVGSEVRLCRESLGQIRTELSKSLCEFQVQVTELRESLNQVQQNYRSFQDQFAQLEQRSIGLETQVQAVQSLDSRFEEIEGTLQTVEQEPAPAASSVPIQGIDPSLLKKTLKRLAGATTQEEILEVFLDLAAGTAERAILFAGKDGSYIPWRSRGFSKESLESVVVNDPADPIMVVANTKQLVYREQAPVEARPSLGEAGDLPHAFVAIPLVFDDFVPVIFYADSSRSIDVDYLEVLSYLSVLVLKNNALQQLAGDKAEQPAEAVQFAVEEKTETPAAPPPVTTPIEAPSLVAEPPEPQPVPITEDWEIPESMIDHPKPAPDVSLETFAEPAPAAPEPEPEPQPQPESLVEPDGHMEAVGEAVSEPIPIPTLSPEEEEKYSNEARRFARLLVSEIKLYNEDEVFNGRQNADLYTRLKRDIDRSREMYEKRVHPAVARVCDHFHEELVRILAREDVNLMGSGYPGPMLRK